MAKVRSMASKRSSRIAGGNGVRWEDRMKRWTLILPKELIEDVKREARRSGRTHSRVVVDALRRELK
jgi:hypothetical protein